VGHTFTVTAADTLTSNLFWTEWYGSAALGTDGELPTTQDADYFAGDYPAKTTGGIWLNPAYKIHAVPTATRAY